jgi:predicted dehydrogenase/threonine dehydrogenase-like Zn-dependent dehydrogenase
MKQLLQSLGSGDTELLDVPVPALTSGTLVVHTRASVVSAGTERMLVDFGRSSMLDKARKQPDRVRQVLSKARTDGLVPTIDAVRAKLDQPIPLGYCNAGVVQELGPGVAGFAPGQRVVTNGPHAEYVRVPWTLAAPIPDGVAFDAAAFTPLAAIGLQGLRLARPELGETVVVYGLGLIGLLTVQLAHAHGCRVIGIDRVPERLRLAERFGAQPIDGSDPSGLVDAVRALTGGGGADAVLLTLASAAHEPVQLAAGMSRKRGRIVLVGVTGLDLRREDFYAKELSFQVSCSFGPGRYDPQHEDGATDYPLPFVRWTEGRNFAAVLQLMADGRVDPLPLVTHRFAFDRAADAYDVITGDNPGLGIILEYASPVSEPAAPTRTVIVAAPPPRPLRRAVAQPAAVCAIGVIGAGNYSARVLIPAFRRAGASLHTVASSGGVSGAIAARRQGFHMATTEPATLFADPAIDTIVIATRHDTHVEYVLRALAAGKHVFVEKPLAIREEDIDRVETLLEATDRILCIGFNRRFAPLTLLAHDLLQSRAGPLVLDLTVNAGALPDDHWTKDPAVGGGRLVGEACHFIDLARHLAGAPILDLAVTSARTAGGAILEDVSALQLSFADGSIATVRYLANGPSGFPKERVEGFWDGRAFRIDNFRRLTTWGVRGPRRPLFASQDKGHAALALAFVAAIRDGAPPPIPVSELIETSRWAARAPRLIR